MRGGGRDPVFLIGLGDEHDGLAQRLLALGYRPVRAAEPRGAALMLTRVDRPVRAAILPAEFGDAALDRANELARLSEAAGGVRFVVTGKPPAADAIDGLRRDGVRFCLWQPFTDSELRFVTNRALYDSTRGEVRNRTRVPTDLVARVRNGAGERTAGVYNLSSVGAYLETRRSAMKGGRVRISLPLPSGEIELAAQVAAANVPGNLKRENLPVGMGVEFVNLGAEAEATIHQYVAQRASAFEL